jgi:hypothetical protein
MFPVRTRCKSSVSGRPATRCRPATYSAAPNGGASVPFSARALQRDEDGLTVRRLLGGLFRVETDHLTSSPRLKPGDSR